MTTQSIREFPFVSKAIRIIMGELDKRLGRTGPEFEMLALPTND